MTVEKVDATVADFDGHFERLFASDDGGKLKLLLFLADREPSSSLTWCPGNLPIPFPKYRIIKHDPCWLIQKRIRAACVQTATWRSR